jgi:hypothetical protein
MGNDQAVSQDLHFLCNAIAIGVYQSINLQHQAPGRDVNTLARQASDAAVLVSLISRSLKLLAACTHSKGSHVVNSESLIAAITAIIH